MCLLNPKRIFPENDIVCYKVLKLSKDDINIFKSIYCPYNWKLNKEYETHSQPTIIDYSQYKILSDNAFHTFKSLDDAVEHRKSVVNMFSYAYSPKEIVVAKCIIPKHSCRIYEGEYIEHISYASTSLIIKEIIKI